MTRSMQHLPKGKDTNAARRRAMRLLAAIALLLPATPPMFAQEEEDAALAAAQALEQVYVKAIARAEKSVVAIARVRKDTPAAAGAELRPDQPALRQPLEIEELIDPTDPDFVPDQFGAGVVIDSEGYIVTNLHVLGDIHQNDYYVFSEGKPFQGKAAIKATDPWLDLAVIKIEAASLSPIVMADGSELKKGQFVIALGNPQAIARDGRASASRGIIANLSRRASPVPTADKPAGERTLHHYGSLIQTDASLTIGSSGGALINLKGEMIGLTSSLAALAGREVSGGFAIPVDDAFRRAVNTLKSGHQAEYGFLGVAPGNLPAEERRAGRRGAVVADVVEATPAYRAGLRVRDVITHIDGRPVEDANTLIRDLSRLPADARVKLTVERPSSGLERGRRLETTATLTKKHIDTRLAPYSEIPPPSWRGMRVDYPTAISRFQELSHWIDPEGCLAVTEVEKNSPAWKAGIRPWSFVFRVGDVRVASPQAFFNEVAKRQGEVPLLVAAAEQDPLVRKVAP